MSTSPQGPGGHVGFGPLPSLGRGTPRPPRRRPLPRRARLLSWRATLGGRLRVHRIYRGADQISLTLVNYVPKTGETPTGAFTLVYYANTDTVGTRRARQLPKQTSAIRAAQRRTSAFGARPSARLSSPMSTSDSRRRRKRQPCGSCQRARHLISASIPRWGSHLRARTARNTVILA
jgi:hypothetical protein